MQHRHGGIPSPLWLMFVAVIIINLLAYPFNWWSKWALFDELMHIVTPFFVILMIGFYFYSRSIFSVNGRMLSQVLALTAIGLLIGVLWEVLEWIVRFIVGRPQERLIDTAADLVLDLVGIVSAAFIVSRKELQVRRL